MSHLYHYCSTAAFHSIISTRSLWLSSLRQSNDRSEGRLVSEAVARLASIHGVNLETRGHLLSAVENLEGFYDGLGCCLSPEGDLLSQWRAYAEDGTGVSLGFSRAYLDWLVQSSGGQDIDLSLLKVEYEPETHNKLVLPVYTRLRELLESDEEICEDIPPELSPESEEYARLTELHGRLAVLTLLKAAMPALHHVFLLKHHAFSEEKEWRLLHSFGWLPTNPCSFRPSAGRLIAYKACPLRESSNPSLLKIVLGPKHNTPVSVVENYLLQHGFGRVEIVKSVAPYR